MTIIQKLRQEKFFAIIRINDVDEAYQTVNKLINAGVKIFEIMIENAEQVKLLKRLIKEGNAEYMAGGIITARKALEVLETGIKTIISPIFQPALIKICNSRNIVCITTATTPNEAYSAWKYRIPLIKIFPTKDMGGANYINDILRTMPFLNLLATGSIAVSEAAKYLNAGAFAVGIGRDLYVNKSVAEIELNVQKLKNDIVTVKEKI